MRRKYPTRGEVVELENRIKIVFGLLGIFIISTAPVANAIPVTLTTLLDAITAARDAVLAKLGIVETKVDNIENKLDRPEVSVVVDERWCQALVPPLCGPDHTMDSAKTTNHNPIALHVLITVNGVPQSGLTAGNFVWESSGIVPAGGVGTELCVAPECPLELTSPTGVYFLYIHPATAPDIHAACGWRAAGTYWGTLKVTVNGKSTTALVSFTIPGPFVNC